MSRNGEFPMTIFYLAMYVVCNFDDLSSFRMNSAKRWYSILPGEIAYSAQNSEINIIHAKYASADPGFFLGGGALFSCSTSKPINHIGFFFGAEYQLY